MATLVDIIEYVQKTADIIASVLDMEVIICDNQRRIVGDSHYPVILNQSILSKSSILNKVMNINEAIFINSKYEYEGCLVCSNSNSCKVQSMIGMPIIYQQKAIGAIGILVSNESSKNLLREKIDCFEGFIQRMSDMLISKLKEHKENLDLKIMKERLTNIIQSMDSGIIAVDENEKIVFYNSKALEFVDESLLETTETTITQIIDKPYIEALIKNATDFRNKEILFSKNGAQIHGLIGGKAVTLENHSAGAILTLKRITDIYEEINQFSNTDVHTTVNDIIGNSPQILNLKKQILKVAKNRSTVLIQGESGTGKELIARAIHYSSESVDKPFIALNCAAIPENLLESELFGYEDGAFTGSKKGGKLGKLQLAHGGTIFLDEIGEMSLHLQAKLLRVLQERTIEKVGGTKSIPIDIRVVAATNKNIEAAVANGEFREDLFYRLNVIPLTIPPLRERSGDVELLLNYFLEEYNKKLNKKILGFSDEALSSLLNYTWKGNIRELQNVVEYAVNMADKDHITLSDIHLRQNKSLVEIPTFQLQPLDDLLCANIRKALKQFGNDLNGKEMAAKALGISLSTLYRKIKEYKL